MLHSGSLTIFPPTELPGVKTLAAEGGFEFSDPLTLESVKAFADMLGRKPVYGEDAPRLAELYDALDGIPADHVMSALRASGVLDPIAPRTVNWLAQPESSVVVVVTGGTINWMTRRVEELKRRSAGWQIAKVYGLANLDRLCDSATEVTNPLAAAHFHAKGTYPTEAAALKRLLEMAGFAPTMVYASNLEEQTKLLMKQSPEIALGKIYLPTNANATWTPLRFRRVTREFYEGFDTAGEQFYFSQDGAVLAATPEQAADTAHYQRPLTVLPTIGRLVEELFLLQAEQ